MMMISLCGFELNTLHMIIIWTNSQLYMKHRSQQKSDTMANMDEEHNNEQNSILGYGRYFLKKCLEMGF